MNDHAGGHESEEDEDESSDILDEDLLIVLGYAPSWQSRRCEEADFSEWMQQLPNELRDLAEALDDSGGNLSEAARMLGVKRKRARILLQRLRQAMAWWRDE